MHLGPLPEKAVRALIEPEHVSAGAVDRIVSRAEGNALFAKELVSAARIGRPVLPTDLTDLLLLRLDELDDDTRLVLRAMSVAGRRVPHELLAQVVGTAASGVDPDGVLRTAIDRNVVVAGGARDPAAPAYAFRHALLAEAVCGDLLPGERVRWHRAYADALRTGAAAGPAADLARHAGLAHDHDTAVAAGARSDPCRPPGEAVRWAGT